MRRVTIFTGSRADYFLLIDLMRKIKLSKKLKLQIIVSGSHLSQKFGNSWKQIRLDNFKIDEKVNILGKGDTVVSIIKSVSKGLPGFTKSLKRLSPDFLIILGDRSEAFSIAQAAMFLNIKIVHLHGGELSEGSYDDTLRHCITKMAFLHFPICNEYRKRIIQMGESPKNVFNFGSLGVERISNKKFLTKDKLNKLLKFDFNNSYFVICYHSATNSDENSEKTMKNILKSLESFKNFNVFISYPNHDNGNKKIIKLIEEYSLKNLERVFLSKYVPNDHFLSVVKNSEGIIGNSSSGLIEVPSLKIPTINVGSRQNGRLRAMSVIDCDTEVKSIKKALKKAISKDFRDKCYEFKSPFEKKLTSSKIVKKLENFNLSTKTSFFDITNLKEQTNA